MHVRTHATLSETQKKRSLLQRMVIVHAALLFCLLTIVARLMKLQILEKSVYYAAAHAQHYGDVELPAARGEILALNSKTAETSILATNTTLDLVYVDPLVVDDPTFIAETLADILITDEFHRACSAGEETCPRELVTLKDSPYAPAFDPLLGVRRLATGSLLEPLPADLKTIRPKLSPPDIVEVRRRFARDIEERISSKRVTFVPLKYSATKEQKHKVLELSAPGIYVNDEQNLIYANPEEASHGKIAVLARSLAVILESDPAVLQKSLRSRPLRYVPAMRRLPPKLSLSIKERKLASLKDTNTRRSQAKTREEAEKILDPLRSIALIDESWRFYPDGTIASHVIGFLNTNQEAQYGIERTFEAQLRGREGRISTLSDHQGGQILTADQTIIDPEDGDTIVLTIDPFVQKEVERILQAGIDRYGAESGQAIVMDPFTGRILAMANAPLFERNSFAGVYQREPIFLPPDKEQKIVVEVYHPVTNVRLIKGYKDEILTEAGRSTLSEKNRDALAEVEAMYDLQHLIRYYHYIGENARVEVFPTAIPHIWLKYRNNLGVGAYLNRTIQEIYEPGSVMKPVTMAIALDQGEVTPSDTYNDIADVEKDTFVIKNAGQKHYGLVTMTQCLEFSVNTCMTSVSEKLGKKLFHRMVERFGFGRITGIELEDELSGEVQPWRRWSDAALATIAFGQGISSTPLQVISASAALANGGKLMKPMIVERIHHADGTVEIFQPKIVDQVITPATSKTITAMLVSAVELGFASPARVKGYRIAGKTGTSQIARPGGGYETGTGSTIASFMGYAPAQHAKFIALIKLDRPKWSVHGAQAAAPMFQEIAAFLLEYYGVPPS